MALFVDGLSCRGVWFGGAWFHLKDEGGMMKDECKKKEERFILGLVMYHPRMKHEYSNTGASIRLFVVAFVDGGLATRFCSFSA